MPLSSPGSLKLKIWREVSTTLSPWKMSPPRGAGLGLWAGDDLRFGVLDSLSVQRISSECQLC